MASSFMRFLDHTQRRITVGRTPPDEWSARHRDLYLTIHNSHKRQTSMPSMGFEPTISAGERPQTYALGRAATGTGPHGPCTVNKYKFIWTHSVCPESYEAASCKTYIIISKAFSRIWLPAEVAIHHPAWRWLFNGKDWVLRCGKYGI